MKISNIFLRAIFSYKFVLIMMTLLALGAGIATFLESRYDTQTARILVYGAL